MNSRYTVVETSLNRAEFRWKWLQTLRFTFVLGAVCCALLLFLGASILLGWLTNKNLAILLLALVSAGVLIIWAVRIISLLARSPQRNWLAAAVEQVDRRLMDRLNTLLFLETRRGQAATESFGIRIARQTQKLLAEKPSPSPFVALRSWLHFIAFTALLIGTVLFYQRFSVWNRLITADRSRSQHHAQADKPTDLTLPPTNNVEQDRVWGEVRIVDPGADLKVTKVDVIPLQIEAAANQALEKVGWYSALNDSPETAHDLPAPQEPRYAVYQPNVYLDEMQLSDWDVLTYYARANTRDAEKYASQVYFMEVRPFREDILKLPGGENGKPHQCLDKLSALISHQQHVIRQTYQHAQKPPEQENLRRQDRTKLAEAEHDLGEAAQHLYAEMAAGMENQPIGEALDNLAKAEQSLDRAGTQLQTNALDHAQATERGALAELVAARKMFQKALTEHPDAFKETPEEETPLPKADESAKLEKMAEFRNESKAAQDFIQKSLQEQRALEQQARTTRRNDLPRVGDQERQLQQALEEFQQQHPTAFSNALAESENAQEAMKQAADSLKLRKNDSRDNLQQATQQLQKLDETVKARSAEQQLADAYRLKQMLDQQSQVLGQCSKPGGNPGGANLAKTANETRETLNQLKKLAEQEPTRDAFGQPLRDSLSGPNKVELEAKLNRLEQAQNDPEKQQRAGEAKAGVDEVRQAFDRSQPKELQTAKRPDGDRSSGQESLSRGMAELESLIKQLEKQPRQLSPENQARLGKEALFNLQSGLRTQHGDNDRGNQILLHFQNMLKGETPLDIGDLKKLMDELQHFSVETTDRDGKKIDNPEVTNIDPSKLPPAYRGRIQKYFQRLSEKQ